MDRFGKVGGIRRTSGAKAYLPATCYGTAEAVPFPNKPFPMCHQNHAAGTEYES